MDTLHCWCESRRGQFYSFLILEAESKRGAKKGSMKNLPKGRAKGCSCIAKYRRAKEEARNELKLLLYKEYWRTAFGGNEVLQFNSLMVI